MKSHFFFLRKHEESFKLNISKFYIYIVYTLFRAQCWKFITGEVWAWNSFWGSSSTIPNTDIWSSSGSVFIFNFSKNNCSTLDTSIYKLPLFLYKFYHVLEQNNLDWQNSLAPMTWLNENPNEVNQVTYGNSNTSQTMNVNLPLTSEG